MTLSDGDIWAELHREALIIDPFPDRQCVQPASVDLHIGNHFKKFREGPMFSGPLNPLEEIPEDIMQDHYVSREGGTIVLYPQQFMLSRSIERIALPPYMYGRMEGKSSLGRLGLLVHSTAGFFDPGWDGTCTLEMYNFGPRPLVLTAGMKICQMSFGYLNTPAIRPYGHPELNSKYQGQEEATASRYHLNA